ncbi:hypothetical protein MAR_028410 [Mya arenaria]|uniref:Uncharacterized protein n=1 Tax=Mya arenaria TaxID=6604 RepID=A0ABY7DL62_MYAAR|nr:uncharacterized protein LOC128212400 [Mya arenaria]XP_052773812.1 uncharacterized protein LOC128212400 [Mya arenaria]XP_052773820.1 uncharacterized protein LOC128212400 [Mya arenaria]XP_052773829.1 uncharacterized protein LOC128212400 [Mya arenaria]WAQ95720.1 hypothetical protein MAR_028410 [Mya arenaria]
MGKDKKDTKKPVDIVGFKTKETLKEEDVALTKQVKEIEKCYQDVYKFVHQLDVAYQSCKEHFALRRYEELKDMIKACITDEVMGSAAKYSATNQPQETGKATKLLQAAKGFSEVSARDEVSGLHKAEIIKDIEEKKKRKDKVELKFLRLYNRLVKLKRDYEESKQHLPMNRYGVMKEIIKPLIRDESLRIDST